jgi:hypothetical protein
MRNPALPTGQVITVPAYSEDSGTFAAATNAPPSPLHEQ